MCKKTLNPTWEEEFKFEVADDSVLQNEPIEFKVQCTYKLETASVSVWVCLPDGTTAVSCKHKRSGFTHEPRDATSPLRVCGGVIVRSRERVMCSVGEGWVGVRFQPGDEGYDDDHDDKQCRPSSSSCVDARYFRAEIYR